MAEFTLILVCAVVGASLVHFAGPELIGALFGALIGIILALLNTVSSDSNSWWKIFENKRLNQWIKKH